VTFGAAILAEIGLFIGMLQWVAGRRGASSCPFAGMTRIRLKGSPPALNSKAADSQPFPGAPLGLKPV